MFHECVAEPVFIIVTREIDAASVKSIGNVSPISIVACWPGAIVGRLAGTPLVS